MVRALIAHLDDVGMCHGANIACLELMGAGFVTTGSVMVPCPWFPEIAAAASQRAELDLGVHLTLTSEWAGYRWRPISTASRRSGLIDETGHMWRDVGLLRRHLDRGAAAQEMRAQIETALAAGINATHLDTHMGAAAIPELVDTYLDLGREYRLPVLLPRELDSYAGVLTLGEIDADFYADRLAALEAGGGQFVDRFVITPCVSPEQSDAVYRRLVGELPEGVTFFSLHANAPGEMAAISPGWAVWRADEYRLCGDPAWHAFIRDQGIDLWGFRDLRERYRAGRDASAISAQATT